MLFDSVVLKEEWVLRGVTQELLSLDHCLHLGLRKRLLLIVFYFLLNKKLNLNKVTSIETV